MMYIRASNTYKKPKPHETVATNPLEITPCGNAFFGRLYQIFEPGPQHFHHQFG
jgi:hypothetical protein